METTRQNKISRLLQKELSEIFRQETSKTHGVLVSVSVVRVSPDLSVAKAYLSIFPSEKAADMLESIRDNAKQLVKHFIDIFLRAWHIVVDIVFPFFSDTDLLNCQLESVVK